MIITGPKDAVLAARALNDAASRLPNQTRPCPKCGKTGITIADDDHDLVTCTGCGRTGQAWEYGATLRVYRDEPDPAGAKCVVTDETAAKVAAAKDAVAKAPKDSGGKAIVDEKTAKLAACTVTDGGGKVTVK